jgi:hypothetical protein
MKSRSLLFFACLGLNFFSINPLFSQTASPQLTYARQVIDTLASPAMHGRGYVNQGDKLAAGWIADEFKKMGLSTFSDMENYFQPFSFPVNTFPDAMTMTFIRNDGKTENGIPGIHFLVHSDCPSIKGEFPIVRYDSSVVYTDSKKKAFDNLNLRKSFVLVDTTGVRDKTLCEEMIDFIRNPKSVKGILIPIVPTPMSENNGQTCTRITSWEFSQKQSDIPVIEIDAVYKTVVSIRVEIDAKFISNYTSQNVIGYVKGSESPNRFIVYTAHYDHLGQMGKDTYFPGANDNASGMAMLLNLARHYSQESNRPKYSIAFIAFSGEEVALLGSAYYTSHPAFPLSKICFLVNMDIMGTGDEGITTVNATLFDEEFEQLKKINQEKNYLPLIKPRGKAAISDHYFFTERNVKCFFIYTLGGIKAYHDTCDRRETLPLTKFTELFQLLVDFTTYIDTH